MHATVRHARPQQPQFTGEPLRPIAFIPLTGGAPAIATPSTAKRKGAKKKLSGTSGDRAVGGLTGRG